MSRTIFLLSIIGLSLVAAHIHNEEEFLLNSEEFHFNHEDSFLSEFNFLAALNSEGSFGETEVAVAEVEVHLRHSNEYNFNEEVLNHEGEFTFDNQFNFLNSLNAENEVVFNSENEVAFNAENEFSFGEEAVLNHEGEFAFDNQFNFLNALNAENEVVFNSENEFSFGEEAVLNHEGEFALDNQFNFLNVLSGEHGESSEFEFSLGSHHNEYNFGEEVHNGESETLFDNELYTEEVLFSGKNEAVVGNGEEEVEGFHKDALFSIDMIKIAF